MRYIRGPPANEWNENFYLIPCKWFYRVFNNRANSCYHFENRNINNFAITIWSVSHVTLLKGLERRRVPECPGDQAPYCESHWNSFMYWFFFFGKFYSDVIVCFVYKLKFKAEWDSTTKNELK